jgi:uncharacterized protein YfaT (DUF1175 family)
VFLKNGNFFDSRDCSGILRFFAQIEQKAGLKLWQKLNFVLLTIY